MPPPVKIATCRPKVIPKAGVKPSVTKAVGCTSFVGRQYDPATEAGKLHKLGYVVLPMIDAAKLPDLRRECDEMFRNFPVYRRSASDPEKTSKDMETLNLTPPEIDILKDMADKKIAKSKRAELGHREPLGYYLDRKVKCVQGGFAALGNPGSFHDPLVRKLRSWAMDYCYDLFGQFEEITGLDRNLECLPDRFMYRVRGEKPTAEAWHRDTTPLSSTVKSGGAEKGDDIFGGWINLDSKPQSYSAYPSTAIRGDPNLSLSGGFTVAGERDRDYIAKHGKPKPIVIPPGHIIVFFQNMLHEVVAKQAGHNMYRLFTGFRLTHSSQGLTPYLDQHIRDQAPLHVKSLQYPSMFAPNHMSFMKWKTLIPWSVATFQPECLVTKKTGTGKVQQAGSRFVIVDRHMKSLKEYGLPMYPAYAKEEVDVMKPARSHRVLKCGTMNYVTRTM